MVEFMEGNASVSHQNIVKIVLSALKYVLQKKDQNESDFDPGEFAHYDIVVCYL